MESLWARSCGNGAFEIDNIPFFVKCVSYLDKVAAKTVHTGGLEYTNHVEYSKHSTLRVIVFEESGVPMVRDALRKLGCSSELSHVPKLIAVDVPPDANIDDVISYLVTGEKNGLWEYEEAAIWKNDGKI